MITNAYLHHAYLETTYKPQCVDTQEFHSAPKQNGKPVRKSILYKEPTRCNFDSIVY